MHLTCIKLERYRTNQENMTATAPRNAINGIERSAEFKLHHLKQL